MIALAHDSSESELLSLPLRINLSLQLPLTEEIGMEILVLSSSPMAQRVMSFNRLRLREKGVLNATAACRTKLSLSWKRLDL